MEYYNKHYIRTNPQGYITYGFSDAFEPPREGDICINEQGGYQFKLFPGGAENPPLMDDNGCHLYKWDGVQAIPTTPEERAAELAAIPSPPPSPSPMEQLRADVDLLLIADLQREGIL